MDLRLSNPDTLYLTDNGCCLCGKHLGSSARFTGHDISGQEIMEITEEVRQIAAGEFTDWQPRCEMCDYNIIWPEVD